MTKLSRFIKSTLAALFIFLAVPLVFAAPPNQVVSLKGYSVVPIKNGVTSFNFGLRGGASGSRPGYIVSAERENFNAHGFDLTSFYAFETDDNKNKLGAVPLFDKDEESFQVTRSGGADCVLHDFRLLETTQGKPTLLIVANRDSGHSFVDEETVTFNYYQLKENAAAEVGRPYLYFARVANRKTTKKYCDVGRAFLAELGLGLYQDTQQ